jgi:hypothetical protein
MRSAGVTAVTDARYWGGNLVRRLQERYGFIQIPTRLADFDYEKGVKFLQGMFDGHKIDMEVFENAIRAYSAGGTDVCDAFIDDMFLASREAHIDVEELQALRIYTSVVEVEMDWEFAPLFRAFTAVGKMIGAAVEKYGGPGDPYQGTGLTFIGSLSGSAPEPFRIERRAESDFDSNLFFSSAPLALSDHLTVLAELERSIS